MVAAIVAADAQTTVCLYMGCADIAYISGQLIAAGRSAGTPAMAAIDVERPGARLITSTLGGLAEALAGLEAAGPVFITIGEAAAQARDLATAEAVPLLRDLLANSR